MLNLDDDDPLEVEEAEDEAGEVPTILVTTTKKFKPLVTLRLKTKMLVIMLPLIMLTEVGAEAVDEVEAEGAEVEADEVGEDEVNRVKMLPPLLSKRNNFLINLNNTYSELLSFIS